MEWRTLVNNAELLNYKPFHQCCLPGGALMICELTAPWAWFWASFTPPRLKPGATIWEACVLAESLVCPPPTPLGFYKASVQREFRSRLWGTDILSTDLLVSNQAREWRTPVNHAEPLNHKPFHQRCLPGGALMICE